MNAAHNINRDLGQPRILHIDTDKTACGAGMLHDVSGDGLGQLGRLLQPHLGQLEADVGVEAPFGDRVKQLVVDVGGAVRFAL